MPINRYTLDALRRTLPGVPEFGLTMATSLPAMAGSGLGTLAGMAKQKLSGDDVDLDAATETVEDNASKFTFAPRSEAGAAVGEAVGKAFEPLDRGMQTVGQKAADVTGSPAVGAAVYTGLNMLDPQMLAPGAAKVAALRAGSRVAREGAKGAVPMGEALAHIPKGQRGAYTREDLNAVEGDYSFKSPTLAAFAKLKPQEQGRVSGRQLTKALQREGAKKEELYWMGLDKVLDTDELLSTADVQRLAEENQPTFEFKTQRGGEPDEEAISDKARDLVYEDSDLSYPEVYYVNSYGERVQEPGRGGRYTDRQFSSEREAEKYLEAIQQQEYDDALENANESIDPETWEAMSDEEKEAHAQEAAENAISEHSIESETDTDSEPENYDELHEYWSNHVRENPGDYNLEGGKPDYGEYTVGEEGEEEGANYGVSVGRLRSEARFMRGPQNASQEMMAADNAASGLATETDNPPSRPYQIEALRRQALQNDPNGSAYMKGDRRSHYRDMGDNQMFFTRETDRHAPDWGTVQQGIGPDPDAPLNIEGESPQLKRPARQQEESQSDWYQAGRKTGWSDEKGLEKGKAEHVNEQARVRAFQEQALGEMPTALEDRRVKDWIAELERAAVDKPEGMNVNTLEGLKEKIARYNEMSANPEQHNMGERISAARNLWNDLYRNSPSGSEVEAYANQMRDGLDRLPSITRSPLDVATASGPMRESSQYRKLALIDSLRRAVAEGQQYFSYTPGDIHSKRWGTDSLQFAADPTEAGAGKVRWTAGGEAARQAPEGTTAVDALQAKADSLLEAEDGDFKSFDPYADDAQEEMKRIVEGRLNYGMSEYPNPDAQMEKRAAALLQQFRSMVPPQGMGPPRPPAHYSPRAFGNDAYYNPTERDLEAIIKQAGSSAKLQDWPQEGGTVRGFEFDPALAQALKKGMLLPY